MPLYKTIKPNKHTTVYVWKIEASFDELSEHIELTEKSKNRMLSMRSELHQRGFLSIRHLLQEAGYTDFDLYYNGNGKPHFVRYWSSRARCECHCHISLLYLNKRLNVSLLSCALILNF